MTRWPSQPPQGSVPPSTSGTSVIEPQLCRPQYNLQPGRARHLGQHPAWPRTLPVRLAEGGLDTAIDLEACQRARDTAPLLLHMMAAKILGGPGHAPSDYSATVVSTQTDSPALARLLAADKLRNAKSTPVAMSSFSVTTILDKNYLIDDFDFPPAPKGMTCAVSRDVRSLATKLAAVHEQPLIGILSCKGVVKDKTDQEQRFSILFRLPPGFTAPQSLRHALASTSPPPLSDILRIGQDLAAAISLVHAFGFVHKNVRPETVVLRRETASCQPSAALAGFEKFRLDGGRTGRVGDESWGHNVYRHSSRHGRCPAEAFVM